MEAWYGLEVPNGEVKVPFVLVGDFALTEPDDSFLTIPAIFGFEAAVERWPIGVGEVVLVIEPLLIKEPGRSPNLGKANWKSLPPL